MKNIALMALGGLVLLASCGSFATDGTGSAKVTQIRTEYKNSVGFVACDKVVLQSGSTSTKTQVGVYFDLSGQIQDVTVALKGNTTSNNDSNYSKKVGANELTGSNGSYKMLFYADSESKFLPASIIVSPAIAKVKMVSTLDSDKLGSFHTDLVINTGSSTLNITSKNLGSAGNIPVYKTCTITSVTNDDV